jgi:hypothetical protein
MDYTRIQLQFHNEVCFEENQQHSAVSFQVKYTSYAARTHTAFDNRLLRRIGGPKREEVAGGWRRLHNEELRNPYASPNIIIRAIKSWRMRWAGHVTRMVKMRNAYKIFVGRSERKIPLGRPRL